MYRFSQWWEPHTALAAAVVLLGVLLTVGSGTALIILGLRRGAPLLVAAAGVSMVAVLVAPLVAWAQAEELASRFGADVMVPLMVVPAVIGGSYLFLGVGSSLLLVTIAVARLKRGSG